MTARVPRRPQSIGWCELVDLPDLCLTGIAAKMDSGAATSALHAQRVKRIDRDGQAYAEFWFRAHPGEALRRFEAPLTGLRAVKSSNGKAQQRFVIETTLRLGNLAWRCQFTLANRGSMRFPLLLGRRALRRGFLVDSSRAWTLGQPL